MGMETSIIIIGLFSNLKARKSLLNKKQKMQIITKNPKTKVT